MRIELTHSLNITPSEAQKKVKFVDFNKLLFIKLSWDLCHKVQDTQGESNSLTMRYYTLYYTRPQK